MTFGLKTWSATGQPELDLTTRLARVIAVWNLGNPLLSNDLEGRYNYYTSPPIPGLVNDPSWFIYSPVAVRIEFIGGGQIRCLFFTKHDTDTQLTLFRI